MLPLPASIVSVLQPFACLFTAPTLAHLHVLLAGTLLAQGPSTVTAALRVMGLNAERRFERDHRALNRARWSLRQGARILLGLLDGWRLSRGVMFFERGRSICSGGSQGETPQHMPSAEVKAPRPSGIARRCRSG
ncbi:hypothetical protein [Thiocapsa rosea]|uniref:Uncharacterized protein n=1 Tax=Thiocapsa rosea TaxID=69360 RepID=A0A495VC10_9GAMM|nr:hypothetical protein [Thiocapsa rosea]RKT46173.1 hypothetical protein BDD21_3674 [Thiocapsa rosea]